MARRKAKRAGPRRFVGRGPLIARLWLPGIERIHQIEGDARDRYELTYEQNPLLEQYVWRVYVVVPGYDIKVRLRIELKGPTAPLPARVYVEEGPQPQRHKWHDGALCMWHPHLDPPERKWGHGDGLTKLIDTSVVHLFKELYHLEHPEEGWLGDEIHGDPKPREVEERAAEPKPPVPRAPRQQLAA